jgi:hypothetical protein
MPDKDDEVLDLLEEVDALLAGHSNSVVLLVLSMLIGKAYYDMNNGLAKRSDKDA